MKTISTKTARYLVKLNQWLYQFGESRLSFLGDKQDNEIRLEYFTQIDELGDKLNRSIVSPPGVKAQIQDMIEIARAGIMLFYKEGVPVGEFADGCKDTDQADEYCDLIAEQLDEITERLLKKGTL